MIVFEKYNNFDNEEYSSDLHPILSTRVLVLNQSYEPLTVCSTQRALALIFLTKAEVIENYKDKFIRTPNRKYPLPSIIRLQNYIKVPYRSVEISRKNIIKRDNATCQYCGSRIQLTIDHILPKSRGGQDTWENLVTACIRCNNSKGNRTPKEADMKLMSTPKKPNYIMFLKATLGKVEDNWKQYLFF